MEQHSYMSEVLDSLKNHPLFLETNKKVIVKFKDELNSEIVFEFLDLWAKMYSLKSSKSKIHDGVISFAYGYCDIAEHMQNEVERWRNTSHVITRKVLLQFVFFFYKIFLMLFIPKISMLNFLKSHYFEKSLYQQSLSTNERKISYQSDLGQEKNHSSKRNITHLSLILAAGVKFPFSFYFCILVYSIILNKIFLWAHG